MRFFSRQAVIGCERGESFPRPFVLLFYAHTIISISNKIKVTEAPSHNAESFQALLKCCVHTVRYIQYIDWYYYKVTGIYQGSVSSVV